MIQGLAEGPRLSAVIHNNRCRLATTVSAFKVDELEERLRQHRERVLSALTSTVYAHAVGEELWIYVHYRRRAAVAGAREYAPSCTIGDVI